MKTDTPTTRPPSKHISKLIEREVPRRTDSCVPVAMVSRSEAASLGLDARALFVFGFVNDRTPVFDLLTMSGLPLSDAAQALASLCDAGAVALVEDAR